VSRMLRAVEVRASREMANLASANAAGMRLVAAKRNFSRKSVHANEAYGGFGCTFCTGDCYGSSLQRMDSTADLASVGLNTSSTFAI